MTGAGSFWFANPGQEFYNGVATQSLRFDSTRATTLYRDIAQAGNRKIATYAFWFKFNTDDVTQYIFSKGDGGGVQTSIAIGIFSSAFGVEIYSGDSKIGDVKTTRLLRDTSSWYHLVVAIDVTQGTSSNKIKLYVNGVQETDLSASTYPSDTNLVIGDNSNHTRERIGDYQPAYLPNTATGGSASNRVNGYLCDFHHVDGQQLAPTSFGEFKNGIWIAKDYTGNHGDNGFRLEFKQTGDGQTTAGTSTIGADTGVDGSGSATSNHFKDQNFDSFDSNIGDSPENNFCTLNSEGRRYGHSYSGTFSQGNLKFATSGNASGAWGTMAINQIASQGGVYFEVRMDSLDVNRTYFGIIGDNGSNNKNSNSNGASYSFPIKGLLASSLYGYFATSGSTDLRTGNTAFSNGDVAGIAILSDGKFFCHRNGTYMENADGNTGNPSTGANPLTTVDLTEGDWVPYVGYNSTFTVNFGQDGSFNGTETSGGNQDANGIGDFMFSVPTNCLAICSSNMAEPTIGPNSGTQSGDHFNALLYTGNGSTQSITGVGFKPDWTWSKDKDNGVRNVLTDSSRGVYLDLFSDINTGDSNDTNGVTAFNADGFSLGSSTNHNVSSRVYVSWNWKANGGTTTTNDASATGVGSIDSVYQANTTSGFSIVTYTGSASSANNGTASTVAHGLGAVPKWIWLLPRDTYDGCVYHEQVATDPATDRLLLKTSSTTDSATAASDSDEFFNDTEPTSTVFSIGTRKHANSDGGMVAYCFAEVEGFSKFGSYIGNGSTDGPFVYTGFQPAFLMIKRAVSGTGNWIIHDNARDPTNESSRDYLYANLANAQGTDGKVDFLSNGFKQRSPSSYTSENASGSTYVYMAFAEAPFKYANAK